jgi:hypothetical protein
MSISYCLVSSLYYFPEMYRVTQMSLCTYTTSDKTASCLVAMPLNWHSRRAAWMAAHVDCWRSMCTFTRTSVHELKERDSVKRVEYCREFRGVITISEQDILDIIFFTDEAWFRLSCYVNSRNSQQPAWDLGYTITSSEGLCVLSLRTK